jgi:hypothetical protein
MATINLNELIKTNFADPIITVMAKEDKKLRQAIAQLGTWCGSATSLAEMPTVDLAGKAVSVGDTATLTQTDGNNPIGLYRYDGSNWVLEIDYSNLDIGNVIANAKLQGLIKDNTTVDDKFVTPKQVAEFGSETYHPKQGDPSLFVVGADAEEGTQQFVTANQLTLTYTEQEAQTKYDAI